jgi:acyl dehydratase
MTPADAGPTGLYYEDWEVGKVYETRARTVTLEDVNGFGKIEGSMSPMHLDPEYAKQTVWGKMSIHGVLTVSIAAGLMGESGLFSGTALAFLDLTWQFRNAIFVEDQVRARWWISSKKPTSKPGRGLLTRSIEVLNQDDVVCCTGTMTTLWSMRDAGAVAEAR